VNFRVYGKNFDDKDIFKSICFVREFHLIFAPFNMRLSDYTYQLPKERIASKPLPKRDSSNLLVYRKGNISHRIFRDLHHELDVDKTLFFNDTKVIPARIFFKKETGALIEIFLLEPVLPYTDIAEAMACTSSSTWKCLIGNLKKWKSNDVLQIQVIVEGVETVVTAELTDRENMLVRLNWQGSISFSELVESIGRMPLPPYIKREVSPEDKDRYQTVYRRSAGAVAAPTAGLHFTEEVLSNLQEKGIHSEYLTLHVSAGTFMPVKEDDVRNHRMHSEQVYVTRTNVEAILKSQNIIAVGTTSMRTLESLYWYGVSLLNGDSAMFRISQDYPYENLSPPERDEAMQAILNHMDYTGRTSISGSTEIFIRPGYDFKVCNGLITNFHLPESTLILLVAAFIGEDWKKVYQEAMNNNYRFLSYGDSSLLLP
jgi:S-adenosylmethionine:tRNA ribosyltransferase-isomerase